MRSTARPTDLDRTPGGSPGGAAAALAAGFVSLELGSDIGGSLRAPAHFCGVFSHKPTLDLVPQRGAGPPQTPVAPVRGDLAVAGPMARSAADLMLELAVLAGPDELAEGVGYQLALPPPRHDRLAGFRALVMDAHPLCPTAASVAGALDELTERLAKLGVHIVRDSPKLPDLALTTQTYVELLAAFFAADLTTDRREAVMAGARSLSADDKSIAACRMRGFTISHGDWILASRQRATLRGCWLALFDDVDVVLCPAMPPPPSRTITRRWRRANSPLMSGRDHISTSSPGLAPPPSMACPRRRRRSDALIPGCRSVSRSLAVFSTTAQRSPSPAWSSASSAASRRPQCCNRPTRRGRPGTTPRFPPSCADPSS